MKNLNQSKSQLQSNLSASSSEERVSRNHISNISYKFSKRLIFTLVVIMTLSFYNVKAITPVCLSLWYNSNDVDLGYVNGKKLITMNINAAQNQAYIDVSSISNGIYFLKLANESGYISDLKFVISR